MNIYRKRAVGMRFQRAFANRTRNLWSPLFFVCMLYCLQANSQSSGVYLVCNGTQLTALDTVELESPSDVITLTVVLYGPGSVRTVCIANWSHTGTLRPLSDSMGVQRLFYQTWGAISNEEGFIIAKPIDTTIILPVDRVYIRVKVNSAIRKNQVGLNSIEGSRNRFSTMRQFDLRGKQYGHFVRRQFSMDYYVSKIIQSN